MTAAIWVDLFEMVNLRGRARRVFGPMAALPFTAALAPWHARIESVASGPLTFVRLYHSEIHSETIYWLSPNGIIDALADIDRGQVDMLDILDRPPRQGELGYELFIARFSSSDSGH